MSQPLKFTKITLLAAVVTLISSCISPPRMTGETLYLDPTGAIIRSDHPSTSTDTVSYWMGDDVSGSSKIRIKLSEQKAYFYKGGKLVGVSVISTGKDGYATPRGSFSISQKSPNHRSNLYGQIVDANGNVINPDADIRKHRVPGGGKFIGASMPYFMRFIGGVGMHAGYVPGYPASHGCVRMPSHMAQAFYRNVSNGTPVIVE